MTTVDDARAALLNAFLNANSLERGLVDAFEAAVRAEYEDDLNAAAIALSDAQGDAEAKLAALREAAARAERDCRTFIDGTFDRTQENMARSALDALLATLAATPAEDHRYALGPIHDLGCACYPHVSALPFAATPAEEERT